jgi:predicted type IV restriction endonuclease
MSQDLLCTIDEIRANPDLDSYDEAMTKQAIILRLLAAVGWNQFHPDEVRTEYVTFGKRVDYSLRINGINKVFIEVKQTCTPLESCEEQRHLPG